MNKLYTRRPGSLWGSFRSLESFWGYRQTSSLVALFSPVAVDISPRLRPESPSWLNSPNARTGLRAPPLSCHHVTIMYSFPHTLSSLCIWPKYPHFLTLPTTSWDPMPVRLSELQSSHLSGYYRLRLFSSYSKRKYWACTGRFRGAQPLFHYLAQPLLICELHLTDWIHHELFGLEVTRWWPLLLNVIHPRVSLNFCSVVPPTTR